MYIQHWRRRWRKGVCQYRDPVSLVNAVQNLSDNPPLHPRENLKPEPRTRALFLFHFATLSSPLFCTPSPSNTHTHAQEYKPLVGRRRMYLYMYIVEMNIKGILRGFAVLCCLVFLFPRYCFFYFLFSLFWLMMTKIGVCYDIEKILFTFNGFRYFPSPLSIARELQEMFILFYFFFLFFFLRANNKFVQIPRRHISYCPAIARGYEYFFFR